MNVIRRLTFCGCRVLARALSRKDAEKKMFKKSQVAAAERNKSPILEVLRDLIKVPEKSDQFPSVKVLEIASGTGQHVAHFANNLHPQILWQPTDIDTGMMYSTCAYILEDQLKNVAPPVYIDIREDHTNWKPICSNDVKSVSNIEPIVEYAENSFDYIYSSNLIHISSFDCTEGLFCNSGKLLKKGGCLITYGPYGQNGEITPQSNVEFNESLKLTNPNWGVRDVQQELVPLAEKNNLKLIKIVDMPANNKILVWEKQ